MNKEEIIRLIVLTSRRELNHSIELDEAELLFKSLESAGCLTTDSKEYSLHEDEDAIYVCYINGNIISRINKKHLVKEVKKEPSASATDKFCERASEIVKSWPKERQTTLDMKVEPKSTEPTEQSKPEELKLAPCEKCGRIEHSTIFCEQFKSQPTQKDPLEELEEWIDKKIEHHIIDRTNGIYNAQYNENCIDLYKEVLSKITSLKGE